MKTRIEHKAFEKILQQGRPLFFYELITEQSPQGVINAIYWKAESRILPDPLEHESLRGTSDTVAWCFVRRLAQPVMEGRYEYVEVEEFDPHNREHLHALFCAHYHNVKVLNLPYGGRELVWFLTRYIFGTAALVSVLREMTQEYRSFFLDEIKRVAPILSPGKQKELMNMFLTFGVKYEIFYTRDLQQALMAVESGFNPDMVANNANIFNMVNRVIFNPRRKSLPKEVCQSTNLFLRLRRWLTDEEYVFDDFRGMLSVLRLCVPWIQLQLLCRYFLAVEKGQTLFNAQVIRGFYLNTFDRWGYWYRCYYNPVAPVGISIELLAISILTATEQREFPTCDELLAFACTRSNRAFPKVDFQLSRFFPYCHGGVVEKPGFKGLVCCSLLVEVNDNAIASSEAIRSLIADCFHHKAQRDDSVSAVIGESWTLYSLTDDETQLLNLFMKEPVYPLDCLTVFERDLDLVPESINVKLHELLSTRLKRIETASKGLLYEMAGALSTCMADFVRKVTHIRLICVEPRRNVYFGNGVLADELGMSEDEYESWNGRNSYTIPLLENRWLRQQTETLLRRITGCLPNRTGRFVVPYSEEMMSRLQRAFKSLQPGGNSERFEKPDTVYTMKGEPSNTLCLPESVADSSVKYVRCRGRKCFRHAYCQADDWTEYTLPDFIRIMAPGLIKKAPGGNIPTRSLVEFGHALKEAERIFPSLACSYCGHLRERTSSGSLRCVNPDCPGKR